MGIVWNNCPECGGEVKRNDELIPGRVVASCRRCKSYWIDGDAFVASERVMPASEVVRVLKDRAANLAHDEERDRQMWESDITDPRWEPMA